MRELSYDRNPLDARVRSRVKSGLRNDTKLRQTGPNHTKPDRAGWVAGSMVSIEGSCAGGPLKSRIRLGRMVAKRYQWYTGVGRQNGTHPPYTIGEIARPKIPMESGGSSPQWNPTKRGAPLRFPLRVAAQKVPRTAPGRLPEPPRDSPTLRPPPFPPRAARQSLYIKTPDRPPQRLLLVLDAPDRQGI